MSDRSALLHPKKMLLIVNPVSGRKTGHRFQPDIVRIFTEAGYQVTVFPTGARGEATYYTEHHAGDFERIVCVGGDGTLHEVIDGMVKGGHQMPLGYLPAGSTNDFALAHHLDRDMIRQANAYLKAKPEKLDLGSIDGETFVYVAAFGAFSDLSYSTSQEAKNTWGYLAYLADAVNVIPKIRPLSMELELDDGVHKGKYVFGAVSNSVSIAGAFQLPSEMVNMADGKMEVILISEPKTPVDRTALLAGLLAQDYSSPFIEIYHTKKAVIRASSPINWSLDGEKYEGKKQAVIEVLPQRLTMMI